MDPSIRLYIHHQQSMVIQQTSPKNSFEIVLLKLAVTYIQRSTTLDWGISAFAGRRATKISGSRWNNTGIQYGRIT